MDETFSLEWFLGYCPDEKCGNSCYFTSFQYDVECSHCGQIHEIENLKDLQNIEQFSESERAIIIDMVRKGSKNAESTKVRGLSNYQCKLVSHMMTKYGYDKDTGHVRLLGDVDEQKPTFDCSKLSNRAFLIEQKDLDIQGYGIDGLAEQYLRNVLIEIQKSNQAETYPLVPLHADGDGHCLVHSISRCLVGRQLFWHPLMTGLKKELEDNNERYQLNFMDFISYDEWPTIIDESDPDHIAVDGGPFGLRNIHIFALANVLHRPIILLDSKHGLDSNFEFSGFFLPAFVPPNSCRTEDGRANEPLTIAWSSSGRNHFVPLVCVKGLPVCKLPASLIPNVWGVPESLLKSYVDINDDGSCMVAGKRTINDSYLYKLVTCMEAKFFEIQSISASLVADYYHNILKASDRIDANWRKVVQDAKKTVEEGLLYKCKDCGHIMLNFISSKVVNTPMPGGDLHETLELCVRCLGGIRQVNSDGSIEYEDGDKMSMNSQANQTAHHNKGSSPFNETSGHWQRTDMTETEAHVHSANKAESTNGMEIKPMVVKKKHSKAPEVKLDREQTRKEKALDDKQACGQQSFPREEHCIRIRSNEKQSTVSLHDTPTYYKLQKRIEEEFGIPQEEQELKTGYPPRKINPDHQVNEPVPLIHGEMVIVERRKTPTSLLPEKSDISPTSGEKVILTKKKDESITIVERLEDVATCLDKEDKGEKAEFIPFSGPGNPLSTVNKGIILDNESPSNVKVSPNLGDNAASQSNSESIESTAMTKNASEIPSKDSAEVRTEEIKGEVMVDCLVDTNSAVTSTEENTKDCTSNEQDTKEEISQNIDKENQ